MRKYERSRKSSHLDTVHYEIDMLEYSFSRLAGQRELLRDELFSGAKHRKEADRQKPDISVAHPVRLPRNFVMNTGLTSRNFYSTALNADSRMSRNGTYKR